MVRGNHSSRAPHSDEDLARMVIRVVEATRADSIICITETELVSGLGARHAAADAATKRSMATAVVVSATDGKVRAFSGGKMVLQIDPDFAHWHISMNE